MATRAPAPGSAGERRAGSWPLLLIGGGVLLLALNYGWLGWDLLFSLGYLVPLAAIAIGLDLLLGGRHRLYVAIGALVAAALLYGFTSGTLGSSAQLGPQAVAQGLEGASSAEVRISTGVTQLRVVGDAGANLLAEGTVVPVRGERIATSFETTGGVARFSLTSEGRIRTFPGTRGGRWELTLSGGVPLSLDVDTGVGEAVLDLSALQLERLELSTGVGASIITLPPTGDFTADIDTGVGAVTIRVPQGLEARIHVSRGVGAISVPSEFARDGDVYVTSGFATARDRVELRVDSGVGAVDVVRIR